MRRESQLLQKLDRRMLPANRLGGYAKASFAALDRKAQLIEVYDAGIDALLRGDAANAHKVIGLLRKAVNPESMPDFALRLYNIYNYCDRCIDEAAFPEAARVLETLRQTWQMTDDGPEQK